MGPQRDLGCTGGMQSHGHAHHSPPWAFSLSCKTHCLYHCPQDSLRPPSKVVVRLWVLETWALIQTLP